MKPVVFIPYAIADLALVALVMSGLGYRIGLWPLPVAFGILRWAAIGGLVAAAGSLLALLLTRHAPRVNTIVASMGIVIGLATFLIPWQWQRRAASVPRIHDITTDTANPPAFASIVALRASAPNSLDYSEDVAKQQRAGYPDLGPITLDLPPDAAFDRALETARRQGWEIVASDKGAGRIEATDTTFWFGFKDDVVVRLTSEQGRTRVDVRSVSRVGRSDVGTNARRIRRFLDALRTS